MSIEQAPPYRGPSLHLLTGPWAAGKSSVVSHLRGRLPAVVVFDWDLLLPGLSVALEADARQVPGAWGGLRRMWTSIIEEVLASGSEVLLAGPSQPADFAGTSLAAFPVRCAYLDPSDNVLARRLRERGVNDAELADELAYLAALRCSNHVRIQSHERAPALVAEDVAAWVQS